MCILYFVSTASYSSLAGPVLCLPDQGPFGPVILPVNWCVRFVYSCGILNVVLVDDRDCGPLVDTSRVAEPSSSAVFRAASLLSAGLPNPGGCPSLGESGPALPVDFGEHYM